MTKKQICFTIDEEIYYDLKREAEDTGLPLSKILELKIKGYKIVKKEVK